ncbi:MAG TPA: ABC transporter permease [Spirochaetales bacterium]|mgnify:CR=1 FL=1|nr:ABC transporter permease [Spirochaetales bacterium]
MPHAQTAGQRNIFSTEAGQIVGRNWAFFFLILMVVIFSIVGSGFLSITNFQNILHLATAPLLLASAETFVVITGGIDLSIGFVMGMSSVLCGELIHLLIDAGASISTSILVGCMAGLLVSLIPGLINGLLISRFNVPPFIATLGMLGICNGITLKICKGFSISNLPDSLTRIGNSYVFYIHPGRGITLFQKPNYLADTQIRELIRLIPVSIIFSIGVLLFLWYVLKYRKFGRHTYAIGGSTDAAIRAGINVKRHLVFIYTLSSFLAGLAGVFNVFQTGIGNYSTFSAMYELFAVAAVVIGGASLSGGKGGIIGTAVGVLLIIAVIIDQLFPDLF